MGELINGEKRELKPRTASTVGGKRSRWKKEAFTIKKKQKKKKSGCDGSPRAGPNKELRLRGKSDS